MSCEGMYGLLHDWIDDELAPDERETVAEHLETCLPCRRELAALREIVERAGRLELELEPERELWPGIEERLASGARLPRESSGVRGRWLRLAAAAALAAALALPFVQRLGRDRRDGAEAPVAGAAAESVEELAAQADLARSEDGTLHSRRDLAAALERRRAELSSEVAAEIEESLWILDRAVGELRSALDRDPFNRKLNLLLASRYQQESQLAKRMNRI